MSAEKEGHNEINPKSINEHMSHQLHQHHHQQQQQQHHHHHQQQQQHPQQQQQHLQQQIQHIISRPVPIPSNHSQLRSNVWDVIKPHKGRPIVKGGNNDVNTYNYQQPQPTPSHQFSNLQHTSIGKMPIQQTPIQTNPANLHYNSGLIVGMNQNPANRARSLHVGLHMTPMRQQRNDNTSLQQLLLNPNYGTEQRRNIQQDCRPVQSYSQSPMMTSESTSPVSNQLARWFSPELLAQARAGQLPPVSPTHNMLSVEELERLQQQPVLN